MISSRARQAARFPWSKVACYACGGPVGFLTCPACAADPRPSLPVPVVVLEVAGLEAATGRLLVRRPKRGRLGRVVRPLNRADEGRCYRQANPAKVAASRATYLEANRDADRARSSSYYAANAERLRAAARARYASRRRA